MTLLSNFKTKEKIENELSAGKIEYGTFYLITL